MPAGERGAPSPTSRRGTRARPRRRRPDPRARTREARAVVTNSPGFDGPCRTPPAPSRPLCGRSVAAATLFGGIPGARPPWGAFPPAMDDDDHLMIVDAARVASAHAVLR